MKAQDILEAMGSVNADAVAKAARPRRPMPRLAKALTAAACICLVLLGSLNILSELGYGRAGGRGVYGQFREGFFYYTEAHSGLYRHSPETGSEKLLGALRFDTWLASDNGIYYKNGRSLYLLDCESGKSRRIYRAGIFECSHIGFELYGDDIVLILYRKGARELDEYLIDGLSGEVLETLSKDLPYSEDRWSLTHFLVGQRELELLPGESEYRHILCENGKSIMPDGVESVDRHPQTIGDNLWFDCITDSDSNFRQHLVVMPGGGVKLLVTESHYSYIDSGSSEFLFFSDYVSEYGDSDEWAMQCVDIESGERWGITADSTGYPFYDLESDGKTMYTGAPWSGEAACWEIIYEGGRPVSLRLLDSNICD